MFDVEKSVAVVESIIKKAGDSDGEIQSLEFAHAAVKVATAVGILILIRLAVKFEARG